MSPPAPPASSPRLIRLWSPRVVGLVCVLMGYPGGLVLAVLNWRRMGQPEKARANLISGLAVIVGAYLIASRLPSLPGGFLLGLNVAMGFILWRLMRDDVRTFAGPGPAGSARAVVRASWLWAALIGLGVQVALAVSIGLVQLALEAVGVPAVG